MRARRPHGIRALVVLVAVAVLATAACSGGSSRADRVQAGVLDGKLDDGATWQIRTPDHWNGTLLLYSHGYVAPAVDHKVGVGPDGVSATKLLADGFALAASSYATTGWAVEDAISDQLDLLDVFADRVAEPEHTIAWGVSMGGLITTALVEQHPDRFDGGLAMCGVLAGSVALWDRSLDLAFAVQVLLTPDPRAQLVDITTDQGPVQTQRVATLTTAATSPTGRARIALAGALAGLPTPAGAKGFLTEATNVAIATGAGAANRSELEHRFGGNPSTNEGVDYAQILAASPRRAEIAAWYQAAGLDVQTDLAALAAAPRIAADPSARERLAAAVTPTGHLEVPLLTLHSTGDATATLANERAYADLVDAAGDGKLLRQVTTEREGHCTFIPEEVVTAVGVIQQRVLDGHWPATLADSLQRTAEDLDLQSKLPPAFVDVDAPVDARLEASAGASP